MELIKKYFPNLNLTQIEQFEKLLPVYKFWNSQINVISRKDIDNLYLHHVLHSLAIAKVINFQPNTKILDVGTGGGFPGIPLAILFPECNFYLIDSIGKKIKVVDEVIKELGLSNIQSEQIRAEELKLKFHFVISRAVTVFEEFYKWNQNKILIKEQFNFLPNGFLYLKGGDLEEEIKLFKKTALIYNLKNYFTEDFFETKKLVYVEKV